MLPREAIAQLDQASQPPSTELEDFFSPAMQASVAGGVTIEGR